MWRFPIALATIAVLAVVGAMAVASSAATSKSAIAAARSAGMTSLPQLQTQVLAEINDLRRKQGLVPLRLSTALRSAACEQSRSMAEHGFFGHESYGGSPFWKRVAAR